MTIAEILTMPIGEEISGGIVLTVKTTKKWVRLPNNNYVFTVVLLDETGEILADFGNAIYDPLKKEDRVSIITAEVQAADADSHLKALQEGKKLWVSRYVIVTSNASRTADAIRSYGDPGEDFPDWETIVRGKIRCLLVAAKIQSGTTMEDLEKFIKHPTIQKAVDYIMGTTEK